MIRNMTNNSNTIINPLTVTIALIFHKKYVVSLCRVILHEKTNISKEDQAKMELNPEISLNFF